MSKKREIATIVLGFIAALVILVGQTNYYVAQAKAYVDVQTENSLDGEEEAEEVRIFTNDAVSTVVQFTFGQVLHFISDVYTSVLEKNWVKEISIPEPTKFFETLFQRIISPNAP